MAIDQASNEFWDSFSTRETLVVTCCCGRTHFSANDWQPRELERSQKPDQYVAHKDKVTYFDGPYGSVVYGCRCQPAQQLEKWLFSYRMSVISYYFKPLMKTQRDKERLQE